MATIVQPYNDWRERALVNFLGPIVGDWIQRSRENEMNRKNNAAIAQTIKNIYGDNSNTLNSPLTGFNQSSNGWENSFRSQNDSPLAQFDANTAGITPSVQPNPTQTRIPTPEEFQRNLALTIDSKRFGMVNPEVIQKLFTPYLNAAEAARTEQNRATLADTVMAAKNAEERRNNLWGGYLRGDVPLDAVNAANQQLQYENPYLENWNYNAGDTSYFGSRNPRTGEINPTMQIQNSLAPRDAADVAYRSIEGNRNDARYYAGLNAQERENAANREARRYEFNTTNQFNREGRTWEQGMKEMQFKSDDEFRKWQMKQQDELARKGQQLNPNHQALIEQLNKDYDRLSNDEKAIREDMANDNDVAANTKRQARLQEIQAEKQAIRANIYSLYSPQNSTQNSPKTPFIGSLLVGNSNAGRITGHFGDDRKDHSHGGTDIPAPEGTPITMPDFFGSELKVIKAHTNPNTSTFGNHVILEGNIGGQNIRFTMAHMKNGSVRVKAGDTVRFGDVIGEVGNTGRSHGNHLHLEIAINGQKIDPEKYYDVIYPHISRTYSQDEANALRQQNNINTPQNNSNTNPQNQTQDNSPIIWTNHSGGKKLTQNQYDYFVQQAEGGKVQGLRSRSDVDNWLKSQGYSKQQTQNQNNVGLTHRLTDEERQRIAAQGPTGSKLIDDNNSEVMWEHPVTGEKITRSEFQRRLREDNMLEERGKQLFESLGYRLVDTSQSLPPENTDIANGTTSSAMLNQLNYLNGDDNVKNYSHQFHVLPAGFSNFASI